MKKPSDSSAFRPPQPPPLSDCVAAEIENKPSFIHLHRLLPLSCPFTIRKPPPKTPIIYQISPFPYLISRNGEENASGVHDEKHYTFIHHHLPSSCPSSLLLQPTPKTVAITKRTLVYVHPRCNWKESTRRIDGVNGFPFPVLYARAFPYKSICALDLRLRERDTESSVYCARNLQQRRSVALLSLCSAF